MTTISSGPAQEVPTLQRTSGLSELPRQGDSDGGALHRGEGRGGEEGEVRDSLLQELVVLRAEVEGGEEKIKSLTTEGRFNQ